MARLQVEESDDDLPDLATILRKPTESRKAAIATPSRARTPKAAPGTENVTTKPNTANVKTACSALVPKVQPPKSETRRQRPLNSLKNTNLLTSARKTETATAKEVAKDIPNRTPILKSIRSTPRRTAKQATTYRPKTPPSPIGSESEDAKSTWSELESEEELDDTVIEDELSGIECIEPTTLRRKARFPKDEKVKSRKHGQAKCLEDVKEPSLERALLPEISNPSTDLKSFFSLPEPNVSSRPSSSYSIDNNAILRFSPPARSPRKLNTQTTRPSTPPPPLSPSKGILASPSKSIKRIPTPPHEQNAARFWDQIETNVWNEQHSPRKILASPRKKKFLEDLFAEDEDDGYVSPSESPRKGSSAKRSPVKQDKLVKEAKKNFEAKKRSLATKFLYELDQKITKGEIAKLTEETGGIDIVWNKKLNSTAGRAHWKRESVKVALGEEAIAGKSHRTRHRAHIELAEKVIDDEDRLLNVLAHEFCHLANFMISGIKDNPHGKEFKEWAKKVTTAFHHLNINVTTKHSYDITYKYTWACMSCGHEYKRHSKSIDPAKHGCGVCKAKLVQTKPAPRAQGKQSDYQVFIKENFQRVKRVNPGVALGGLMEVLGREYREKKAEGATMNSGMEKGVDSTKEKGVQKGMDDIMKQLEIITIEDD